MSIEMTTSFALVNLTGVVVVVFVSFVKCSWLWRMTSTIAITALLVLGITSAVEPGILAGGESWAEQSRSSPYAELLLFVSLLFGMGARVLSLAVEQRKGALGSAAP